MRYDYVTLNKAAQMLGIGRSALIILIDKGELPGTQEVETSGERFIIMIPRLKVGQLLAMQKEELLAKIASIEAEATQQRRTK